MTSQICLKKKIQGTTNVQPQHLYQEVSSFIKSSFHLIISSFHLIVNTISLSPVLKNHLLQHSALHKVSCYLVKTYMISFK